MSEASLERHYLHLLDVEVGRCMRRFETAKWLSRYWNKWPGSEVEECSFGKLVVRRDLFLKFLANQKSANKYQAKNNLSEFDLEHDALVFVANKIWGWKLDKGAIEDPHCQMFASIVFLARRTQGQLYKAVGHEFKPLHRMLEELPKDHPDKEAIAAHRKNCIEAVSEISTIFKGQLLKSLKAEVPDEIKQYLFPHTEEDAA